MELYRLERPSSIAHGPMLVLLHGLGADEHDLMALSTEFGEAWTVVCPRAPRTLPWGGYSWFDIELTPDGRWFDEGQAAISRDSVVLMLEALSAERLPSALIIGGFSQGAAISLGVALKRPDLVHGGLLMSGACLPAFVQDARTAELAQVPFLVQHGRDDAVLPVDEGRAVRKALDDLHAPVEYREYAMGHEISLESLRDVTQWLGRWEPGKAGGA